MAKDAYWFTHDSNAGRDFKLLKIKIMFTHWGIGIFWEVIEILREQKNYCYPCDESNMQMLSQIIGCGDFVKFKNWYSESKKLGLFKERDGLFFSESLLERMAVWEVKKLNGSKGGRGNKANRKLNESESKANRKHNRIDSIDKDNKEDDFEKFQEWTNLILNHQDQVFEQMLMKQKKDYNDGKATSHLKLLSRYPNMRPDTQQKFRISLLGHYSDDDSLKNGSRQIKKSDQIDPATGKQYNVIA